MGVTWPLVPFIVTLRLDVRAQLHQRLQHLHVPLVCRDVQRRVSALSRLRLDVRTQQHQRLRRHQVPFAHRHMERRVPLLFRLGLDVRAELNQLHNRPNLPTEGCSVQRRLPTVEQRVHVHSAGNQAPDVRHIALHCRIVQGSHAHSPPPKVSSRSGSCMQPIPTCHLVGKRPSYV